MRTTNAQIVSQVRWNRTDARLLSTALDSGEVMYAKALANGSGSNQASQVWYTKTAIAPETSADHDLTAISLSIFNTAIPRGASTLRTLWLVNDGTVPLELGGGNWSRPFGGSDNTLTIGPGGLALLTHPSTGWPILDTTSDVLRITNSGNEAGSYKLVLLGNDSPFFTALPGAEAEARFIYGESGTYDTGGCGTLTYAVDQARWKYGVAISWYNFWAEKNICDPLVDNDVLTGLPNAIGNYQGTVNRLKAQQPNSLVGFYVTLAQIADEEGLNLSFVSTWPRSRPLWTGEWDALGAGTWDNSDVCDPETPAETCTLGRWTDLTDADARELQATKVAEIVVQAKEENPDLNVVFSDNFSAISGDALWGNLMDVAGRFIEKITPLGVGLIANVTTAGFGGIGVDAHPSGGSLTEYFDQAASAGGVGISGIYTEGLCHTHLVTAANWPHITANIQDWINRDWPFGGKRMLLTHSPISIDTNLETVVSGHNRRVKVVDASVIDANTIEIETETPHFLNDTSYKIATCQDVHPTLNLLQHIAIYVDDTTLRLTHVGHGVVSITVTEDSYLHFPFAGQDTDFGVTHALRSAGAGTFNHWNPSGVWVEPLWANDIPTFGVVVPGSLEVVSTHMVNGAECVKEIKYQFASGPVEQRWHHLDFSTEVRRRWRAAS